MEFLVGDAQSLARFDDMTFDIVVEKAMLDSIFCPSRPTTRFASTRKCSGFSNRVAPLCRSAAARNPPDCRTMATNRFRGKSTACAFRTGRRFGATC